MSREVPKGAVHSQILHLAVTHSPSFKVKHWEVELQQLVN